MLRVNSAASTALCNRQYEVANWRIAEASGLAPKLNWVSPDYCYYLSDYVSGGAPAMASLADVSQLLSLMKQLANLPSPSNDVSVTSQWQQYLSKLKDMASCLDGNNPEHHKWFSAYCRLINRTSAIELSLSRLEACLISHQFCHRDLTPDNILSYQGKLMCIDFEYACASHPLFELAGVLASHELTPVLRHELLFGYLDNHPHLSADAVDAMMDAQILYQCFGCCWALLMSAQGHQSQNRSDVSIYFSGFDVYWDAWQKLS